MAREDYIPHGINEFLTWHDGFTAQMQADGANRGFSQAEIDDTKARNTALRAAYTDVEAKTNAKQTAVTDRRAKIRDAETDVRAKKRKLETSPGFDESVGQRWGVVGPEDTTDLTTSKPTLTAESVNPGNVTIGFNKSISDGIMIYGKRSTEQAFTMLAWDTRSPYVDNRPTLAPGPEAREYRAQYFKDDEPIGQFSDVLQVTVPG